MSTHCHILTKKIKNKTISSVSCGAPGILKIIYVVAISTNM